MRQANEEGVRIPSFGPGQLNAEGGIPALDFEAVIIEPLDQTASVEGGREDEESTTRVKEERAKKASPKGKTAEEMTAEWQLELALRTLLQERIQRHGGDLKGISKEQLQGEAWSHSADLFQDLLSSPSFHITREKLRKTLCAESVEELVNGLEGKIRDSGFLKREIGKAVLRVKIDADARGRQTSAGKERQ